MDALPGAPRYGALARRSLDEMLAGARVDVAPYKRDPMDFVLWKPSKPKEPSWPSPAGVAAPGRPGWHIECSAMAMAKLLEPFGGGLACDDPAMNVFDIHGGGVDLVFPHHENEIAQSCCAFGSTRMANYWMHNGFLQVESEKMSKSLGNFVTIRELLLLYPGDALRLNMLRTHYRQPIDWRTAGINSAMGQLRQWSELFLDNYGLEVTLADINGDVDKDVLDALTDDLNTPLAISKLQELYERARKEKSLRADFFATVRFFGFQNLRKPGYFDLGFSANIRESGSDFWQKERFSELVLNYRAAVANNLPTVVSETKEAIEDEGFRVALNSAGVLIVGTKTSGDIETEFNSQIDALVALRNAARARKDWAESDRLRDELTSRGVVLKDSKEGTTWEFRR
jgi:cysteinyl-tRNA synthetase